MMKFFEDIRWTPGVLAHIPELDDWRHNCPVEANCTANDDFTVCYPKNGNACSAIHEAGTRPDICGLCQVNKP